MPLRYSECNPLLGIEAGGGESRESGNNEPGHLVLPAIVVPLAFKKQR